MSARSSRSSRAAAGLAVLACAGLLPAVGAMAGCSRKSASQGAPLEPLKVAAAADLSFAFKEVGEAYQRSTGRPVVFSFGSTGLLEKQLAEGAPFDVFAAANESYADDAVASGACLPGSKAIYASGRIVMFSIHGAPLTPKALSDLTDSRVAKIAIANPDHAPYGKAARQALERAGVWDAVHARIVYGENVQQTLQFAQSGNADVAIVALSLALVTPGDSAEVPPTLYDPIVQAMVVCKGGKAGILPASGFVSFVQSPEGHATMRQFGFLLPGEPVAKAGQ